MNEQYRLPDGWAWTTLGEVVEVRDDLRRPVNSDERKGRNGPYPYYGATGQVGWIDDYLMDGEYVLLGEDGAPFLDLYKPKAYLVSGKCWVNNHAHVLRVFDNLGSNRFIMHLLNNVDYNEIVGGTTRLKLTQAAMVQINVPLPPLQDQHRIVAAIEEKFTQLDATIATLRKDREKLKQARTSLLKAAVEGTLTQKWREQHPDVEPAEDLLARILDERRKKWEAAQLARMHERGIVPKDDKWKDEYREPAEPDVTGLMALPEGWCWATVEQISQIQGGLQKQPSRLPRKNAYPYLRVANVFRNRLDLSVVERMELFGDELETLRLQVGDLLIVEGNGSRTEIGRSAIWNGEIDNCVHQNHIIRVRLPLVSSQYVNYYWNSPDGNSKVMAVAASTSGLYTLSIGKISRLPVPLPPLEEQQQIVAEVERRLSGIESAERVIEENLRRAEQMRQSVLQRAFRGELVPQDANDEPARVLLERIQVERRKREQEEQKRRKDRGRRLVQGVMW